MEFKDVPFMTAAEKQKVLNAWSRLIKTVLESDEEEKWWNAFNDSLYQHLHMHCGFIAHYDRRGFFATYFNDGEESIRFFEHFKELYYSSQDHIDINQAMTDALKPHLEALYEKFRGDAIRDKELRIKVLQAEVSGLKGQQKQTSFEYFL